MNRGEIRWYKFKPPDKKRPIVILTRNSILDYLGQVTVAPITSTIRDIPSEVLLSKRDGMHNDCTINCDHLQTVSKDKIGSLITTLSKEKLFEIRNAICFALFCLIIGKSICTYWTASAMRLQLKLKLHYFQARFLERRMDQVGEYIFSDEHTFFEPAMGKIESPDKQETLYYPTS